MGLSRLQREYDHREPAESTGLTDQQLIDALIERVQNGAIAIAATARRAPSQSVGALADDLYTLADATADHRDLVAHLAGLLDQPTPERRAAALAALDLPQETR